MILTLTTLIGLLGAGIGWLARGEWALYHNQRQPQPSTPLDLDWSDARVVGQESAAIKERGESDDRAA